MSHSVQARSLNGFGMVPSSTSWSNSDCEIPMYVAASGRRRPRLNVVAARSAADTSVDQAARAPEVVVGVPSMVISFQRGQGPVGLLWVSWAYGGTATPSHGS